MKHVWAVVQECPDDYDQEEPEQHVFALYEDEGMARDAARLMGPDHSVVAIPVQDCLPRMVDRMDLTLSQGYKEHQHRYHRPVLATDAFDGSAKVAHDTRDYISVTGPDEAPTPATLRRVRQGYENSDKQVRLRALRAAKASAQAEQRRIEKQMVELTRK